MEKPKENRPLGKPGRRRDDNIKIYLQEVYVLHGRDLDGAG